MIEFNEHKLEAAFKEASSYIRSNIKTFLDDHIDLLENNKFDELFKLWEDNKWRITFRPLVILLMLSKINFLKYMTIIPKNFFTLIPGIEVITIPTNIIDIDPLAFENASPDILLNYLSTVNNFKQICSNWDNIREKYDIICSDGLLKGSY